MTVTIKCHPWVCSLYLARYLDLPSNLDVVVVVVGVRGDPEPALLQSCEEIIHLMRTKLTFIHLFLQQVCSSIYCRL